MGRVVMDILMLVLICVTPILAVWLSGLGRKERERQLREDLEWAAEIFEAITGLNGRWDDMSQLNAKHRAQIIAWLRRHNARSPQD